MATIDNPYYNPIWADAAQNLTTALAGDPAKAGQLAYQNAEARLNQLKADRQGIENQALTSGLVNALSAGGNDPKTISANMPEALATFARAGINDPAKFLGPQWAIGGEAQSGASPAEALVRAAYEGAGHSVPLDLALTPGRADSIRNQDQNAITDREMAVQTLKGHQALDQALMGPHGAPGAHGAPKPVQVDDINKVLSGVFAGVPNSTFLDNYKRPQIQQDVTDYLAKNGALEGMRRMATGIIQNGGGPEDARQQIMDALHISSGTQFSPEVKRGYVGAMFGYPAPKPAGFYDGQGNLVDLSALINAVNAPQAAAPSAAPPAPPMMAPQGGGDAAGVIDDARQAIARGAPRDAVLRRLQGMGVNVNGL